MGVMDFAKIDVGEQLAKDGQVAEEFDRQMFVEKAIAAGCASAWIESSACVVDRMDVAGCGPGLPGRGLVTSTVSWCRSPAHDCRALTRGRGRDAVSMMTLAAPKAPPMPTAIQVRIHIR